MNKLNQAAVAAILASGLAFASNAASAEEGSSSFGEISATFGIYSDYVFRGYSLTDEQPAIQGSLDWSHSSGFYAGVWGSNVEIGTGNLELDYYVGYAGEAQSINYDLSLVYYTYPSSGAKDEYFEVLGSVGTDFGFASVTVGVGYSWDQNAIGGDAVYFYGDLEVPVPVGNSDAAPYLFAHLGHQDWAGSKWLEWNAGVGVSLIGLDFTVSYIDTDEKDDPLTPLVIENDAADSRVVVSVSKSF